MSCTGFFFGLLLALLFFFNTEHYCLSDSDQDCIHDQ